MIIQNGLYIGKSGGKKGGKILISTFRHDYKTYKGFMVDGGLEYTRRTIPEKKVTPEYQEIDLTIDSSLQEILNKLVCERLNVFWKDIPTVVEIQEERKHILDQWQGEKPWSLGEHTRHHALLHMYVGGYWIVKKNQEERAQEVPTTPKKNRKAISSKKVA